MIRIRSSLIALSAGLYATILLLGAPVAWSQTKLDGLTNFGRVTDMLYRGAQPSVAGFKALQQMGVAIIVNFRDEHEETIAEQHAVESLGIQYVGIPWSGDDNPSDSQVVQFLDLVRANPQTKIFVHCKRGADRTGVMIAAYRVGVEHKTVTEAVSEMDQFHYAHFLLPHLARYVNSLPQLLRNNPLFSAYVSAPSNPSIPSAAVAVAGALGNL